MRASGHFKYDPNATYIVLTPPKTIGTVQPLWSNEAFDATGNGCVVSR